MLAFPLEPFNSSASVCIVSLPDICDHKAPVLGRASVPHF